MTISPDRLAAAKRAAARLNNELAANADALSAALSAPANRVTDPDTRTDVQPGAHVTVRHNGRPTRVYVMSTARQGATLIDFVGYHADFGPNRINDGRIFKPTDLVADVAASDTAARNRVTDQETRTDADALRDTANHHQGTRVHAADDQHGRQLRRQGLVGPRGGLTRRGSIAAERLRNAALDDAFGPL